MCCPLHECPSMQIHSNPHARQIYMNTPTMEYKVDAKFERLLTEESEERPWVSRANDIITVVHWGQRKLLLSEIEFLTRIGKDQLQGAVVVYAGAAPGIHINYLADLFPTVLFVLFDSCRIMVHGRENVAVIHEFLSDDIASCLSEKFENIYFISDIRTEELSDANIMQDMMAQQRWHSLLKAKRSMLKCRWLYGKDDLTTEYLDGDMYLPVWGRVTTTECRLVVTADAGPRLYSHRKHEYQMNYFNTVTRHSLYSHIVSPLDAAMAGLDHCYDCTAEIEILRAYIEHFMPDLCEGVGKSLGTLIALFSLDITRRLNNHRTL